MDIIDALKLIIAKSPNAAENAVRTISAARNNSPILQARYSQVLIMALADPEADFTPQERQLLSSVIEGGNETRDFILRVRLTEAERQQLAEMADQTGQSLSDYVRDTLFK